jgi:hypothetical protein
VSARYGLRFGPVALCVEGAPPHPSLDAHRAEVAAGARRVLVSVRDALPTGTPGRTAEAGFHIEPHPGHDHVTVLADPARHAPWLAAVCEVVAREAPARRALLLHAGAVTVPGGVALLVAAPGVGKTTAVRAAGERAFASNAVIVELRAAGPPMVWSVPFNRDLAPELESAHGLPLAALGFVHRASAPTVEWIAGTTATTLLMPHVTRPRGDDPAARARADLALSLLGVARSLRLGLSLGPGYLAALDDALHPTMNPV